MNKRRVAQELLLIADILDAGGAGEETVAPTPRVQPAPRVQKDRTPTRTNVKPREERKQFVKDVGEAIKKIQK